MGRLADTSRAPGAPRRGRLLPARLAAPAALLAALVVALVAAGPAAATFRARDDWRHVDAVVAALAQDPPSDPVVLLLGGSAARESLTTEPNWRRQIAAFGGGSVSAYNLGASSQGYKDDLEIVRALPAVPTILLIGLNLGRYTTIPPQDVASGRTLGAVYDSHRFHDGQQLSDAAKRALVARWLREKYPRFRDRYEGNAGLLRTLIALCQERGFYPVLVELPINLPVVRHTLDRPRDRYHAGCRAAALEAGVPYEDFVGRIGLVSHDFVDFSHLVEPGASSTRPASPASSSTSLHSTASPGAGRLPPPRPRPSDHRHPTSSREGALRRPWLRNRSSTRTSRTRRRDEAGHARRARAEQRR